MAKNRLAAQKHRSAQKLAFKELQVQVSSLKAENE
jgi:hypothetical protein